MHPSFQPERIFSALATSRRLGLLMALVLGLWGCASQTPAPGSGAAQSGPAVSTVPDTTPAQRMLSRWVPVPWADLPGWIEDDLGHAWGAALTNCERPPRAMLPLCPHIRRLALADDADKRRWLQDNLRPYRVESHEGEPTGLLTGYYEPVLPASRQATGPYRYPLYQMPLLGAGKRMTQSRREIEQMGEDAAGLKGRQIVYLDNPVDVLMIQIQGSARLQVAEPDGRARMIRVAFAGTNDQPYQSVARWLLDRGEIRDASWPSIKRWVQANAAQPQKVQAMFWSNPRMVFFKEERLSEENPATAPGPKGAQGVPLTAGRSIAVDRRSIPYGLPVWLVSESPSFQARKLVFAQDTGSAITGAVRADYFVGSGEPAGELAGRLKQGLRMWVLWPADSKP